MAALSATVASTAIGLAWVMRDEIAEHSALRLASARVSRATGAQRMIEPLEASLGRIFSCPR